MIGPKTHLVSYTKGILNIDDLFRSKIGRFGIYEWDEETYFWVLGEADAIEERPGEFLTLHFHKPEDPSAVWLTPQNTSIQVSLDQQVLTSDGRWVPAIELSVGDKLQHFCGNGHTAVIDSIDPAIEAVGYDLIGVHFGTFVVCGLILKGRKP